MNERNCNVRRRRRAPWIGRTSDPGILDFTTKEVAKIGDLKIQTNQETWHVIPPILAGGALAIGLMLVGAGYLKN